MQSGRAGHAVTKSEVDSFLAAAGPAFARRLLFSTTDRPSSGARRAIEDHNVVVFGRDALIRSPVDWAAFLANRPGIQWAQAPRPHQEVAIREVVSGLREILQTGMTASADRHVHKA